MWLSHAIAPTSQNVGSTPVAATARSASGTTGWCMTLKSGTARPRELAGCVRLTPSQQDREMRDDPEDQDRSQAEPVEARLTVRVDRDRPGRERATGDAMSVWACAAAS